MLDRIKLGLMLGLGALAKQVKAGTDRLIAAGVVVVVVAGSSLAPTSAHAAEPLALGLIVKLKEAQPQPVVRFKALAVPSESLGQQRLRMASVGQRARLSFAHQQPTAFGALVVHNRRPMRMAEAQAEAARLRQDADVEWVVVNELLQPMAFDPDDRYYPQQNWMQRPGANAGGSPNIPAALDLLEGRTLSPVVVAVLDTGILPHPDLEGRVYRQGTSAPGGYDFVSNALYDRDGSPGLDSDAADPGDFLSQATIDNDPANFANCEAGRSTWHGTAIAGLLGARANNVIGVAGMLAPVPGVPVLPVRVAGTCGASVSDILEGIFWSAGISYNGSPAANPHPARVITLSFGGQYATACACASSNSPSNPACLYQEAVRALTAKGALLVASAGNGEEILPNVNRGLAQASQPASCPGVLAVTGLHRDGAKVSYANLTPPGAGLVSVATLSGEVAAGVEDGGIVLPYNAGTDQPAAYAFSAGVYQDPLTDYASINGTSFSAPIAAGAVALMWSVNPNLSVAQILSILANSGVRPHVSGLGLPTCSAGLPAARFRCECTTSTCGPGVLDVGLAVAAAISATTSSIYTPPAVSADFFAPTRLSESGGSRSSGGGAGAMDLATLLGLAAAVVAASVVSKRRQRDKLGAAAGAASLNPH